MAKAHLGTVFITLGLPIRLLNMLTSMELEKEEINMWQVLVAREELVQTKKGEMGATLLAVARIHTLALSKEAMGMEVVVLALGLIHTCPVGVVGVGTKEVALVFLPFEVR